MKDDMKAMPAFRLQEDPPIICAMLQGHWLLQNPIMADQGPTDWVPENGERTESPRNRSGGIGPA